MNKQTLRIGMLGFGAMGKAHAYAVTNLPYFYGDLPFTAAIAGVATSSPERAAARVAPYGLTPTTEEALLADPTIDIIDICTPNIYHADAVRRALAAGKHVLCEKPLGISAAEGAELADLAANSGKVCRVVFNNRFIPAVMRAKQLIDEGRLGRILSFHAAYLHNSCCDPAKPAGWKQNADICGGGVLFDLGSHVIDMVRHLCGEFSAVTGMAQIGFADRAGMDGQPWQTNADEAFYMICGTRDGAMGTVTVSKLTQGANDELSFSVNGELGSLSFSLMDPNYLNFYDATVEGSPIGGVRGQTRIECVGRYPSPATGFPTPKAPVGWLRGHIGSMAAYLTAVYEDRPASPSFADGAYVQSVMEAAQQSAETRREVSLC